MFLRRFFSVLGVLAVSGCLTDEGDGPALAASLTRVASSDNQQVPSGGWVTDPLKVNALTGDGSPALRASISWEVVGGPGGSVLADSVTVSDGAGDATVRVRVGAVGTHAIRASLVNDRDQAVTFNVIAIPAPTVSSVTPSTFSAGDTIDIGGENFTESTRFDVSGSIVTVVAGSLSATAVTAVAPPCLPGGTVEVSALFAGVGSTPVSATYTPVSAPILLNVGEYVAVRPADVAGCATIPAASDTGAQYLIAPQSRSRTEDLSVDYLFRTGAIVPTVATSSADEPSFAARFHDFLREQDRQLPNVALPESRLEGAFATAQVQVGDRRDFVVCDKLGCSTAADFAPVRAEARYVGTRAAIYTDLNAPSGGLAAADYAEVGALFDAQLYDVGTRAFGAESDVDRNGHVAILLSPVVNQLTPREVCEESFVTGFFFSIDINPVFAGDPRSNQGEVFYALVPDPTGQFGCTHSKERIKRAVPVTFVHEFQHMISFHQHVLLRGGQTEISWLNEGMSHAAEELAALRFLSRGDSTLFSRFAIGNIANAYDYLENTGATSLVWNEGTGNLAQRGAGWLFVRWLADQFGERILRRMSETRLTSAANVEAAVGEPFRRLLTEWFLANWVSDLPDFEAPQRLRYTTWRFRTTFASLNEQAPDVFPEPFPIMPVSFSTATPFSGGGRMWSGSGEYYLLNQAPGGPGRALEFTAPSGQPLGDVGSPVLNIIRIQ